MDLDLVNNVDPFKAVTVVFLAAIGAAVLLFFWNASVGPTLRSTLQKKAA